MSTSHESGPIVESDVQLRGSLGDWQALKDESLIDLNGKSGTDAAKGGLVVVHATLPLASLTVAASAAREAALGTADGRRFAIAGDDEEDTAVETNEIARAAAVWTDVATAPGDRVGLARDWAHIDFRPAPVTSGELDLVSAAGASAAPAEGATLFAPDLPTGVEIPPPMGAAILRDDKPAWSLRVSIGRMAACLLVTFVVGFAVGGWWLESRGRTFRLRAFAATGRPLSSGAAPAAPAPPPASGAPIVEPIPHTPAAARPATAAAVAEAPAARPAPHRAGGRARRMIKLPELELTIPDLPPSP
jgi:hypothetical protein